MDLFNLAAKLTLDSEGFDKGIVGAEKSGKGLASSLEGTFSKIKKFAAGALSVAALKKGFDAVVDLANATSDYGDKVDKQSQVLGLSRKAYQEWDYILGQNGASIDSLGVSMKTLNSLVLDAAAGGKESKNAFAQLGLGIHEIEQLEPEKQFEEVVRAFQKMPAGAQKSALAVKIFGRNGMELLPLLNQSSTSIDELRARAEELGIIMSDDAVDASVAYNDAMDDLNRTFNGLKYSVGAKLLPAFTTAVQKVTGFAGKISKAFQENGIQGVWDTLVESFKDIKWPTWSDVKSTAIRAWNTIKEGAKNLAGLVFGTNSDGSVAWPTWEDVKQKAADVWNGIKDKALAIADTAGALVFGKNEDGTVAWPTWEDVKTKAEEVWGAIKAGALNLAGLVFGKKEDGSVDWPTWDDVKAKASEVWETIKAGAKGFAGLVFGTKEDGSVAWPDLTVIMVSFTNWWDNTVKPAIQEAAKWTIQLFGLPEETAESFGNIVSAWWDPLKKAAEDVLNWALNLPDAPYDAGTQLHDIIVEWWDGVKTNLQNLLNWVLGLPKIGDEDGTSMVDTVKTWWTDKVVPFLGDVLNFTLGLFGLPSVDDMVQSIETWWGSVKEKVGNLVLDIIPSIFGLPTESPSTVWESDSGHNHGGGGRGFAKGLNYVPFDGFPALLHRGEQVITASQARRNRGISGGSTGIDTGAIASAVSGAIRSAMEGVSVNSYLSGKDITDNVDRDMARKLKARRFAT